MGDGWETKASELQWQSEQSSVEMEGETQVGMDFRCEQSVEGGSIGGGDELECKVGSYSGNNCLGDNSAE